MRIGPSSIGSTGAAQIAFSGTSALEYLTHLGTGGPAHSNTLLRSRFFISQDNNNNNAGIILHTSHTSQPIIFAPQSAEVMRIDAGNVNIGSSGATAKLHVFGTTSGNQSQTSSTLFSLETTTASAPSMIGFRAANSAGQVGTISKIGGIATGGSGVYDGDLLFSTRLGADMAEKMRITSAGNVGIGTTSPITLLSNSSTAVTDAAGVSGTGSSLTWVSPSGGGYVAALSNSSSVSGRNGLLVKTAQTDSSTYILKLESGGTNQLSVRADGNVGIGTTAPTATLHVNGTVRVEQLAAASGTTVCIDGDKILASCSSSRRYKENIVPLDLGLDDILKMRPVEFKWKNRDEQDLGFIAEEINKVSPLLNNFKDGQIEGVKYGQVTAVLVKAVQELKRWLDHIFSNYDARFQKMEAENALLKASLCELKPDLPVCSQEAGN